MGAASFGDALHELLRQRGWSIPKLAKVTGYTRGYLWELASGDTRKTPSRELIEDLDDALDGKGALSQAWHALEGDDMQRREVLRDLGVLALVPVLAQAETTRFDLHHAVSRRPAIDWWEQVVADYARSHYLTAPHVLVRDLLANASVLTRQISAAGAVEQQGLCRVASQLAVMTALAWSNLGQLGQARRWWVTARDAADASGERPIQVFARAWEVLNGPNIGRTADEIFQIASEAMGLAGHRADAGTCSLLGGLAQAQATAGHPDAVATLRQLEETVMQLPADVTADKVSLFGFPEVRLRFAESYVHSVIGQTEAAYRAQDNATVLYGSDLGRDQAKLRLHCARCMVIDGDVAGGTRYAHQIIDDLRDADHCAGVFVAGRAVLAAVHRNDTRQPAVKSLTERLAITS